MTEIVPVEDSVVPIHLVPTSTSPQEHLAVALANRPELKEATSLVAAACERLRRERYAPLVPSVLVGASYDGFGGGTGDTIGDFNDRADFDAMALWQIRNLGYGEQAARQAAGARVEQETMRQVRVMDTIAREVAEADARVRTRFARIDTAHSGLESAQQSYNLNFNRIREAQGLPIEVLQAIQSLDANQRELVDAQADYNIAQFQLQRALGWPVQIPSP
jgi:outer membrane protein TolC